jgi:hypothetical protein
VHFACHAHADLATPSNNGLCLHDDTLPLPDIIRLHLADAELAYLSACSTAHGGTRLTDEALHLASAFQMAGYWHVIATLWPLSDHAAATAAAAFMTTFPTPAADHTATALHHITRDLRDKYLNRPTFGRHSSTAAHRRAMRGSVTAKSAGCGQKRCMIDIRSRATRSSIEPAIMPSPSGQCPSPALGEGSSVSHTRA